MGSKRGTNMDQPVEAGKKKSNNLVYAGLACGCVTVPVVLFFVVIVCSAAVSSDGGNVGRLLREVEASQNTTGPAAHP